MIAGNVANIVACPATGGLSAPPALLVVAVSYALVAQGAFYPHQFKILLGVVVVSVALSVVVRHHEPMTMLHPFPAMVAALVIVAGVSGWAGGSPRRALPTVALLAVLCAAFVVARRGRPGEREALVTALIVVGLLTASSGVAGVVLRRQPLSLVDQGLWRASSTLTYANATGGFLLIPTLLALGRTVCERRRLVWPLAAFLLLIGIVSTLSRGAIVALAVGFAVLAARGGFRTVLVRTWPVLVGTAIGLAGILPTMPDRLPSSPMLSVAAVTAGGAVVILAQRGRRLPLMAATAGVLAAVLLGASQLDLQRDLASPRVNTVSPARLDGWAAAIEVFLDHPILGAGPGNATYAYVTDDGESMVTLFVHNEYLQLLAEMGVLGFLVLTIGLCLIFWRLRRPGGPSKAAWLGGVAGLAALCVHSALDFLWHVPAVPLAAAVVLGVVSSRGACEENEAANWRM